MSDKTKILVVEDFEDSRALVVLYLRRFGYEVAEARDGIEALDQVATIHPDLIIMDISMPQMDGLEATARLKANPITRDIPVLISTAHTQSSQIFNALNAGAVDVLIKPVSLVSLGQTVVKYLRAEAEFAAAIQNTQEKPADV